MTKIDVLNTFAEIAAVTHYKYDGLTTTRLPFDLSQTTIEPVLKSYKGWQTGLDNARYFDELPASARAFLQDLEDYLGVPIRMISTGPEREKLLVR